ncbi:hypothetical protein RFI_13552, partial [Reticulomyxa filosa]
KNDKADKHFFFFLLYGFWKNDALGLTNKVNSQMLMLGLSLLLSSRRKSKSMSNVLRGAEKMNLTPKGKHQTPKTELLRSHHKIGANCNRARMTPIGTCKPPFPESTLNNGGIQHSHLHSRNSSCSSTSSTASSSNSNSTSNSNSNSNSNNSNGNNSNGSACVDRSNKTKDPCETKEKGCPVNKSETQGKKDNDNVSNDSNDNDKGNKINSNNLSIETNGSNHGNSNSNNNSNSNGNGHDNDTDIDISIEVDTDVDVDADIDVDVDADADVNVDQKAKTNGKAADDQRKDSSTNKMEQNNEKPNSTLQTNTAEMEQSHTDLISRAFSRHQML